MTQTNETEQGSSINMSEPQPEQPKQENDQHIEENTQNPDKELLPEDLNNIDRVETELDLNTRASEEEVVPEESELVNNTTNDENTEATDQEQDVVDGDPENVTETINDLSNKIESLLGMFENKLAYDTTKQQQVDSLHSELQKYKSDLIAKTTWPLINGLIQMYAFNNKRIIKMNKKEDDFFTRESFIKEVESFQEDIEILLEQNGVLAFTDSKVSDEFAPQKQRALETTKTEDESLQGKIAKSIRAGFEQGEKIIQKEFVNVYVYDESMTKPEEQDKDALVEESPKPSNDSSTDSSSLERVDEQE